MAASAPKLQVVPNSSDIAALAPPSRATPATGLPTRGGEVARIIDQLHPKQPLLPWQRMVADRAMEIRADGRYVHREISVVVPRRAGKSRLMWSGIAVHRCITWEDQRVWLTAQTGEKARNRWFDMVRVLRRSSLMSQVESIKLAAGREAVHFANGSIMRPFAPVDDALNGEDSDLVIVDEAQTFTTGHGLRLEESYRPTQATRWSPQTWRIGTTGKERGWFDRHIALAEASLATGDHLTALYEWAAPFGVDATDPAVWARVHPAVGALIDPDFLAGELLSFGLDSFSLEYLCVRTPTSTQDFADAFARCEDPGSRIGPSPAWAVDVGPDRRNASIVAASLLPDGRVHVEVIDSRPGSNWLLPRLRSLVATHRPAALIIDPYGPAGAIAKGDRGLPWHEVPLDFVLRGCDEFAGRVNAGALTHLGQPPLVAAVKGATRRRVGERWAWSRLRSEDDISPLVAATFACWAAVSQPVVRPRVRAAK